MYKKLSILFGVVAFAAIMIGAAVAYERISSRRESSDDPHALDSGITTHWSIVEQDTPEPNVPQVEMESYTIIGDSTPDELPENTVNPDDLTSDFVMYDAYGNELLLSDFFGKPIILNFWTTWCPSCVQEIPYFQQLYTEAGDDIHILKVNLLDGQRETRERVDNFMADNGYTFPLFFDAGMGAIEYGVRFIPMTFFIDANGVLVSSIQGAVNDSTLQSGLAEIRD